MGYIISLVIFVVMLNFLTKIINSIYFGGRGYTETNKKTYIDENGYRRFIDSNKPVHRWVARKNIGRKLYYGEVVHHRNGNKLDNRPENLLVCKNQAEHEAIHQRYF